MDDLIRKAFPGRRIITNTSTSSMLRYGISVLNGASLKQAVILVDLDCPVEWVMITGDVGHDSGYIFELSALVKLTKEKLEGNAL